MYNNVTIKSDVWSFDILFYELPTYGHSPSCPGMNKVQVLKMSTIATEGSATHGYLVHQPKKSQKSEINKEIGEIS